MARVIVGMSGGLDSSVAALILKEQGYDVDAVTLSFAGLKRESIACAARTAQRLGIRHSVVDVGRRFATEVIQDYVRSYRQGITPNPCVVCNEAVKFRTLERIARSRGAMVATGHYARVELRGARAVLLRGKDCNEQSYFLYRLTPSMLTRAIMPLGNMTRGAVVARARARGLTAVPSARSRDACFVPDGDQRRFLAGRLGARSGPVYDTSGMRLGSHAGIWHFTRGQRRGLGISGTAPRYVIAIDPRRNAIVLGPASALQDRALVARDAVFLTAMRPLVPIRVVAKPRSMARPAAARLIPLPGNRIAVIFDEPQWALAPGQSVVCYQGEILVGGGIIASLHA